MSYILYVDCRSCDVEDGWYKFTNERLGRIQRGVDERREEVVANERPGFPANPWRVGHPELLDSHYPILSSPFFNLVLAPPLLPLSFPALANSTSSLIFLPWRGGPGWRSWEVDNIIYEI